MSDFNKEKLLKAKDVFSNFNDVLIKGNSFSGPASFSPVTTTKAAFGNFINRQSIQLYHVNDSAIVDNSKPS